MNIIIVEDEVMIFRRLKRMIEAILGEDCHSIQAASNLKQASDLAKNLEKVLVCLDLNLSGEDGFDLLRRAVIEPYQTIVVSANVDRAIEAFDLGVVDFIAKPFTQERLRKGLQKILSIHKGQSVQQIAVVKNGEVELINLSDIVAIHGDGDYSRIESIAGPEFLHNKTLSRLEQDLPSHFLRVHRSHLVNMNSVKGITRGDTGSKYVVLSRGQLVPVGRTYSRKLEDALKV